MTITAMRVTLRLTDVGESVTLATSSARMLSKLRYTELFAQDTAALRGRIT